MSSIHIHDINHRPFPCNCRKRHNSSDEEGPEAKSPRNFYYYVLESESDPPSQEDTESVCSFQGNTTASAKDTSDLSSSEDVEMNVRGDLANHLIFNFNSASDDSLSVEEFEVASLSEPEPELANFLSSSSDGGNYIKTTPLTLNPCAVLKKMPETKVDPINEEENDWADTSGSDSEPECEIARKLPFHNYTYCIQCNNLNNCPKLRYCTQCFKVRKTFFPPRPNIKKRKNKKLRKSKKDKIKKRRSLVSVEVKPNDSPSNQDKGECSQNLNKFSKCEKSFDNSLCDLSSSQDMGKSQNLNELTKNAEEISDDSKLCELVNNNLSGSLSNSDTPLNCKQMSSLSSVKTYENLNSSNSLLNSELKNDESFSSESTFNKEDFNFLLECVYKLLCKKNNIRWNVPNPDESSSGKGELGKKVGEILNSLDINNISFDIKKTLIISEFVKMIEKLEIELLNNNSQVKDINSNTDSTVSANSSSSSFNIDDSVYSKNNQNNSTSLCETCLIRPKNGVFVHRGQFGHSYCCYLCSKKIWSSLRRCPICSGEIQNVIKVIC